MSWLSLVSLVLLTLLRALANPFFWLVMLLVAAQHFRLARTKSRLLGVPTEPFWLPTLYSALLGIVGGLVGSVLLVLLGVSLSNTGLAYLWPLAILLMLISPHLLCFSYAGGLLALSSLLFGFPRLEVAQLVALVGALHLVESLLILLSGHLGGMPVYLRLPRGEVVGAFNLQRFWPIPLVAGALLELPELVPYGVAMPDWWPLIRPEGIASPDQAVYVLLPVVAALGYGDIAVSSLPRGKSRRSALILCGYSLAVLVLAVAASRSPFWAFPAAVFTPLGHELTIVLGRRAEMLGRPRFAPRPGGVMVLDTVWGSQARRWGLEAGSVLRGVNGRPVSSRADLAAALAVSGPYLELEYTDARGKWQRLHVRGDARRPLGIIPVPEPGDPPLVEWGTGSLLRRLFRK
ncbi:MAG: PDZ domain-containing protein [Clostridia bacterium]|nr:PDZ domain-containing protein [Clostridia bacterium]MDH7572726.1 PDZ domain-containing protein [Clostridia bacterium]